MQRNHVFLFGGLLVALLSFGAADAIFVEPFPASTAQQTSSEPPTDMPPEEPLSPPSEEPPAPPPEEPMNPPPEAPPLEPVDTPTPPPSTSEPPPAGAVVKRSGPDPIAIAEQLNFSGEETAQQSLLSAIVSDPSRVTTRVLLLDGDRAGLLSWIETPNVKQVFMALKESVSTLFSPDVRDLLDEMQSPAGKPPRNFLTFLDPSLSEERFVFVRIRERLYEFHIAPGKDEMMYRLVEELTK